MIPVHQLKPATEFGTSPVREHDDWGQLKKRSVTPQRRLAYQKEHRVLVDALRERDIDKAKVATLAHLQHVRRNLLGE